MTVSNKIVGIIAEDKSDIETIDVLIRKILKKNISKISYTGRGGGNLIRKCNTYANLLHQRGCNILIIIHDSDSNNPNLVLSKIRTAIKPCPFAKYFISIPIQEIEAWFLSDPNAIKRGLNLKKLPKITGFPENIDSPKEHLGRVVRMCDKSKFYTNTAHNKRIAQYISLPRVIDRCPTFSIFHDFVKTNL